ncbi:MAG TPA: CDP-alcohol phosphatidyltransferase family protein [Kofleriaceae bacterium]|jgi:phosphatidylglycerophosphate synthase|nr:CDP-alcohol phosphatidyltransferase family protein [Kofleriaceae bacterium]
MNDADFSYLTGAVWVVLIVAYAIRVSRFGKFRSERVRGVGGGTVLVGESIMQATYWAIDPVVRGLVRLGATPNAITIAALITGLAAGAAVAAGWFGLACLLATCSTISDILDGQVARVTRTGSDAGELLDAAVDRYTEFAFIAGFILYVRGAPVQVAIALAALFASFMISYVSAKAEALQVAVPRGLMRRHERATYLTMASGLTPLLGPSIHARWPELPVAAVFVLGLAIVGSIGNLAALQRLVRLHRSVHAMR